MQARRAAPSPPTAPRVQRYPPPAGAKRSVPAYGTSAGGRTTEPSGCRCVSSSAAMVLGSATPDAFRVWTNSTFPPGCGRQRMLARRAWKSVNVLELEHSSHAPTPGAHTSRSYVFAAKARSVRHVAARQCRAVDHLVAQQVRDRHFRGGDEEQVVRVGAVRVLCELGELPRAFHDLAPREERRLDLDVAVFARV